MSEEAPKEKTPKPKKAITIYVPETTYKKLASFTESGSEKQIGALATKAFSAGMKKIKTKKVTTVTFED